MPGHLIRRLHQISVGTFTSEVGETGITSVQFAALNCIAGTPGLDQRTLAQRIALDTSTTAGVIDRLESRGAVERRSSPKDRRVRVLYATESGLALLSDLQPLVEKVQERLMSPLSAKEQADFLAMLDKLVAANNLLSRAPSVTADPS
jgi:DNA-binding MarR family transcriptional regulator